MPLAAARKKFAEKVHGTRHCWLRTVTSVVLRQQLMQNNHDFRMRSCKPNVDGKKVW